MGRKNKLPKKRNLIAKDLFTPKYRMRVVPDKRYKIQNKELQRNLNGKTE